MAASVRALRPLMVLRARSAIPEPSFADLVPRLARAFFVAARTFALPAALMCPFFRIAPPLLIDATQPDLRLGLIRFTP